MPSLCAAVGCSHTKAQKRGLTFYYFPKTTARRQRWVAAMKRKDWVPTAHSRLCSEHFVSGRKSENPLNPDYVPSLFEFLSPEQRQQKIHSYMEFQKAHADSSDGVEGNEGGSETLGGDENGVHEETTEDATVETLPMKDEADEFSTMQEAFNDDDTAKRKLEVEAEDIEDGDPSAQIGEAQESTPKKTSRSNRPRLHDKRPSPPASRPFDSSALGDLTQKITAIIGCPNKVFNLKAIARELGVPRRRLYDVTNVLQEIMFLEKVSKSFMRWLGPPVNQPLNTEMEALVEQEMKLDELIEDRRLQVHRLFEDSYRHGFAYLTYEDLRAIPTLRDRAVIVIKAPAETKLEVSHPRESFRIHLRSSQGPIDVFMCRDDPQEAPV